MKVLWCAFHFTFIFSYGRTKSRWQLIELESGTLSTKESGNKYIIEYGDYIESADDTEYDDSMEHDEEVVKQGNHVFEHKDFVDIKHFGTSGTDYAIKQRPPEFKEPICDNPPCLKRKIKVKVYIENNLWNIMSKNGSDPAKDIIKNMEEIFVEINKHLGNLDNGGYMIEFDKTVVKLENSDVVLKETYVDRMDQNATKVFNQDDIRAFCFAFQESVALLKNRTEVDLRIIVVRKSQKDPHPTSIGLAEENCLCNPGTFACIATFAIQHLDDWAYHKSIFAHEIGHTLGMALHDNEFYTEDPGNLLMWSDINRQAYVWSPEAKRRINEHDTSCLATVKE